MVEEKHSELLSEEKTRYARQMMLAELGEPAQEAWKKAKVLLVGLGGLGSISASYLCAAGVGGLKIVDPDVVSESNLQRQILYNTSELGQSKVSCAAAHLNKLNPHVKIEIYEACFDANNALSLAKDCQVVVDGTDGKSVRYLMDAVSVGLGIPYAYASIREFQGQVALWNAHAKSPIYRDLFPQEESEEERKNIPSEITGVVGPLPGVAASWQTWEVLNYLCGRGGGLQGRLLHFDLLSGKQQILEVLSAEEHRKQALCEFKKLKQ